MKFSFGIHAPPIHE